VGGGVQSRRSIRDQADASFNLVSKVGLGVVILVEWSLEDCCRCCGPALEVAHTSLIFHWLELSHMVVP
jgi:hypothetical protein